VGKPTQELAAQEEPEVWDPHGSQGIRTSGDLRMIRHERKQQLSRTRSISGGIFVQLLHFGEIFTEVSRLMARPTALRGIARTSWRAGPQLMGTFASGGLVAPAVDSRGAKLARF
jgi:hypothetical protein